jgi:hypothetical protein
MTPCHALRRRDKFSRAWAGRGACALPQALSGRGELSLEKSPNWSSLSGAMNGRRDDRRAVKRRTFWDHSEDERCGRCRWRFARSWPPAKDACGCRGQWACPRKLVRPIAFGPSTLAGKRPGAPHPAVALAGRVRRIFAGCQQIVPSLTRLVPSLMRLVPSLTRRASISLPASGGWPVGSFAFIWSGRVIGTITRHCPAGRRRMISSKFRTGVPRVCAPC